MRIIRSIVNAKLEAAIPIVKLTVTEIEGGDGCEVASTELVVPSDAHDNVLFKWT